MRKHQLKGYVVLMAACFFFARATFAELLCRYRFLDVDCEIGVRQSSGTGEKVTAYNTRGEGTSECESISPDQLPSESALQRMENLSGGGGGRPLVLLRCDMDEDVWMYLAIGTDLRGQMDILPPKSTELLMNLVCRQK